MLVASEEATRGSVMAKQDLISPSSNGVNHFAFCSSVPYLMNTYIRVATKILRKFMGRVMIHDFAYGYATAQFKWSCTDV